MLNNITQMTITLTVTCTGIWGMGAIIEGKMITNASANVQLFIDASKRHLDRLEHGE